LRETSAGKPVLDWILEAYATSVDSITFVAGYRADVVRQRYPSLRILENSDWENTGNLYSLLLGKPDAVRPLFVSYGDVLFRGNLAAAMEKSTAPITVAYDGSWKRHGETVTKRERVAVRDGQVLRLGYDVPIEWADGEFIGVARFSPEAVEHLLNLETVLGDIVRKMSLSDAVEYLRARGLHVAAVDVAGDWAEVRGARDIAYFVLGTKAETLQRLRKVLQTGIIQDQVSFSVADWSENRDQIERTIREQLVLAPDTRLVVRSSAKSEDTFTSSNAGGYDSVLNVDPATELRTAVEQVIRSYVTAASDDQVLVQPMMRNVLLSGVVFTRTMENQAPWYVINYETNGSTEGVTSGSSSDHLTLYVHRGTDPSEIKDPNLAAVMTTILEIEDRLGYDALDIEFAVSSGGQVHVFQVRPIAVLANAGKVTDDMYAALLTQARTTWENLEETPPALPGTQEPLYGVMPDWNPAEIIGTAPGALARTLYRFLIMDETWAIQRAEYGYRDVRPNPLLVCFAGRPYVDVRASFSSFIPASLDEDLAARQLSFCLNWLRTNPTLHDKVEFEVVPTCLSPDFSFWENRLINDAGFNVDEVAQIRAGLHAITAHAFTRCDGDYARIEMLSARHAKTMATIKDPLERAFILLDDCRRYGTLPFAHLARSAFVAVTLLRGAERVGAITAQARDSFLTTIRTVSHTFTEDALSVVSNTLSWDGFVAKYGHLRPGTYDISSPRYDADPETFLRPLIAQAEQALPHEDTSGLWVAERAAFLKTLADMDLPSEVEEVETFLRRAIEGREYAKFIFSRSLSDAIEALAQVGEALGLDRATLTDIPLADLLALRDAQSTPENSAAQLNRIAADNLAARTACAAVKLPPLLCDKADFEVFTIGAEMANFVGQTPVIAECVNLEHTASDSMPEIKGRIVLIPQADPGYDWLFGQGIAGLVTMYGGANSHMAIRAAEFGLPAAIGIGEQRYREICNARILQLDPAKQILQAVS
jgi:choline kinase